MRVYCVGHDPLLLRTQVLVLEAAGFAAQFGDPSATLEAVSKTDFDVVLVSFEVADEDYDQICRAFTLDVRIVRLERFTTPQPLIGAVKNAAGGPRD